MLRRDWLLWSDNVEGSGGSAPPTPAPTPEPTETIREDIDAIFSFDPFAPAEAPTQAAPAAPEPAPTAPPPAPTAEPPVVPTPPPTAPAVDPLLAAAQALQQTAAQLPEAVRAAATPPPPAPPQEDEWAPRDGQQALNYQQVFSQIPDGLVAALGSENVGERKQAIAQLMAVSTHVAHRLAFKQAVEFMRGEFAQAVPTFVSRTLAAREQEQQVFQDFYGKFPALSRPEIRPFVLQVAQAMSKSENIRQWTPEFRDRLGERVLNMLRQVAAPATSPAPVAPQMTPASVRPQAPPVMSSQADAMLDMLRG